MSIVNDPHEPAKPVSGVARWIDRPIAPCDALPNGAPGLLLINETVYRVTILGTLSPQGALAVDGYAVEKADGTVYHIDRQHGECSCADCTFRGRQCKHSSALAVALPRVGIVGPPCYRSPSQMAKNDPDAFAAEQDRLALDYPQ